MGIKLKDYKNQLISSIGYEGAGVISRKVCAWCWSTNRKGGGKSGNMINQNDDIQVHEVTDCTK